MSRDPASPRHPPAAEPQAVIRTFFSVLAGLDTKAERPPKAPRRRRRRRRRPAG